MIYLLQLKDISRILNGNTCVLLWISNHICVVLFSLFFHLSFDLSFIHNCIIIHVTDIL